MRLFPLIAVFLMCAGCKPDEPEDRVLDEALRPTDGEVVDCEGGALQAAETYDGAEPLDLLDDLTLIVGIFLHDVDDVTVRNCTLEGFEVGILAVGGGGHVIEANTFDGLDLGIQLEDAPDVEVRGNAFEGGEGVFVTRRSHRARVAGNEFRDVDRAVGTYDVPAGDGVVYNHIVDGDLVQVPNEAGTLDDIVIEDNDIMLEPEAEAGVYNAVRSKGTTLRNNTITGGQAGIRLPGFQAGLPVGLPGTCSGDPARYCSADRDCFIDGFDAASLGTCTFPGERTCWFSGATCTEDCDEDLDICGYYVPASTVVDSSDITANTITDSCEGIVAIWAVDAVMADNVLTGPTDATHCPYTTGIELTGHAFESATVTGNTATGYLSGINLYQGNATSFGAQVSRNDFGGTAIGWWAFAEDPYTHEPLTLHMIELSVDGQGNWWGLSCDEGVNGFQPQSFCAGGDNHYFTCTGAEGCPGGECVAATSVTDSHPFGESVATASAPCVP